MLSKGKLGARKGFTLVELLAVMAIISILAALLLPAIGKARYQARVVQCKSNLKQVGLAMSMYSQYFGGWLPTGGDVDDPTDTTPYTATDETWDGTTIYLDGSQKHFNGLGLLTLLSNQFIGDPAVLFCPDDGQINKNKELTILKGQPKNQIGYSSYIYRQLDGRRLADADKGRTGSLGYNAGKDQLSDPVLGTDKDDTAVRALVADRNYVGFDNGIPADKNSIIKENHDGTTVNVLYDDGHVESVLNTYLDTVDDLRLHMEAQPALKTGTNGQLDEEMDRVWVLYDERTQ